MWHPLIALFLLTDPTTAWARPPETTMPETLVEQLESRHDGIALWWIGNAGWLIQSDGLLIGIGVILAVTITLNRYTDDPDVRQEIERILIHHFTETLGHRPKMAKHILKGPSA